MLQSSPSRPRCRLHDVGVLVVPILRVVAVLPSLAYAVRTAASAVAAVLIIVREGVVVVVVVVDRAVVASWASRG